jgi:MYXO-CTERM domain-containing protein
MKRIIIFFLASVPFLTAASLARAEPPRDAGASADESFSPGPGGGQPDAGSRRPPLESTGLEDTDFGCNCRMGGSASPAGGLIAWVLAAGAVLRRRRSLKR